jgi:putative transposase
MIALVEERRARVGIAPLCEAVGLARATFSRRRGGPPPGPVAPRDRRPPRQPLTPADREGVLALLHETRFVDLPPAQVWAQVLDAGQVPPCSIRTMYRVLAANAEVRERRNQLRHPAYRKPELLATGPNQVWSWDITKLLGPVKWTYYYLYVLLDIFSRYVVGWLLARQEAAALAKVLIAESCARQHIVPDQTALRSWVRQAEIDGGRGWPGALTTEEREEFTRLRREVRTLRMERDILKKATAFFARENA